MSTYEKNKALFEQLDRIKAAGSKQPITKQIDDRTAMTIRFKEAGKELDKKTNSLHMEVMENIYQSVVVDSRVDYTGRLPEALFKEYFLPIFKQSPEEIAKLSPEDTKNRERLLSDWVKVAGGHYNEVDIIDDAGNVLFSVPALLRTAVINPKKDDRHPGFSAIIAHANLLEHQSPTRSLDFQKKEFTKKAVSIYDKSGVYKEEEQRWLDIFNRYKSEASTKSDSTSTTASSAEFDDELVYD